MLNNVSGRNRELGDSTNDISVRCREWGKSVKWNGVLLKYRELGIVLNNVSAEKL